MIINTCKNCTNNKKLSSNKYIPFAINPEEAVDGIIDFDIPLNVKLQRREKTKLEDELYNCVPHDLFNFLELINDRATKFQWSNNVRIMMIPKDVLDTSTDYLNRLMNNSETVLNMITKFEGT